MKWITPELRHVRFRAAQLLGRDALAGDPLDHLRSGDEHLRLARLNDEIGERRAVRRPARARTADQRDLRHRAGKHHVGVEHLAVAGERSMPSCTRAPPESLMNTNGEPVFSDCCMISATLMECTSPAEPPDTVKSWLARCTRRPPTDAAPVTTPSAGSSFPPCRTTSTGARRITRSLRNCRHLPARRLFPAPSVCRPDAAFPNAPRRRPASLRWCASGGRQSSPALV